MRITKHQGDVDAFQILFWPLVVAYLVLSVLMGFGFDRFHGIEFYKTQIADGWGVWFLFSEFLKGAPNSAEIFYAFQSLIFTFILTIYLRQKVMSGLPWYTRISVALFCICWLGLGQLRLGSSYLLASIALWESSTAPAKSSLLFAAALALHKLAAVAVLPLLVSKCFKKYPTTVIAVTTLGLVIVVNNLESVALFVMRFLGYEMYGGWLALDAPNTALKYGLVAGAISLSPKSWSSKELKIAIIATLPFVLGSTVPPAAGRMYFFFILAIAPLIAGEVNPWSRTFLPMLALLDVYLLVFSSENQLPFKDLFK